MTSSLAAASGDISEVWPPFWPPDQSFAVVRPQRNVLLVTHGEPGPEFGLLPDDERYPALSGIAFLRLSPPENLNAFHRGTFDPRLRSGNVVASAMALREDSISTAEFLIHEAFHVLQIRGAWSGGGLLEEGPLFLDLDYNRLAEIERRLLADALVLEHPDEGRSILMAYLGTRTTREALDSEAAEGERGVERREGAARYVGLRGAEAAGALLDTPSALVTAALRGPLQGRDSIVYIASGTEMIETPEGKLFWAHRDRLYETGAGIALLLDRFGVEWRERLQRGAAFPTLLAEAIAFDPESAVPPEIEAVLTRYPMPEIEARVSALLRSVGADPGP